MIYIINLELFLKSSLIIFIMFLIPFYTNAQSGKAKSLEIGNRWIYKFDSGIVEYSYYKVTGDTIFGEFNYAIITDSSLHPTNSYERAVSLRLFRYNPEIFLDWTLVDYSLEVGDSVKDYVITSKSNVYVLGEMLQEMCLSYDFPGLVHYDDCYVERVGLTSRDAYGVALGGGYYQELEAALIGNKIYGDTTLLGIMEDKEVISSGFLLRQNYPNPFNPATNIQYTVNNRQFVILKVYDILGKVVATLVNEEKPAGNYSINFDGSNLPSGVYIYRLIMGNYSSAKKMILLK